MILRSIIKLYLFVFAGLFYNLILAQDLSQGHQTNDSNKNGFFSSEKHQNLGAIFVGSHKPFSSGDNFMGKGLKGKSGIDFRAHLYLYKQFFIGVSSGASYFEVKNKELVGNYSKTKVSENYFYFGYEFFPAEKLRLGINIAFEGKVKYKNTGFSNPNIAEQYDSGKLNRYGLYLNYELGRHFMVYIDYGYNVSKTNIDAPSELQNFFSKGKYSTVGIGLVFTIGNRDLISRFLD